MTPNLLDELEGVVAKIDAFRNLPFDAERRKLYTDASSAATEFLRTHAPALTDMAKRLEAAERAVWVLARCRGNQKIPMRVLAEFKRHEAVIEEYRDAEGDYHIVARVKGDPAIDATQEGAG